MRSGAKLRAKLPGWLITAMALVTALAPPIDTFAHGSCTGARMRNVGNRCRAIAHCYVREAEGREALDACVAYQLQRLERHFQKTLIYPDCHPYGEPADVISALRMHMGSAADLLQLSEDRCSRAKMEAAGAACLQLLRDCEAPAEVHETAVDPACVAEAEALMARLFDKAEARDECTTVDDEDAVGSEVHDAVDAAVTELVVPPP